MKPTSVSETNEEITFRVKLTPREEGDKFDAYWVAVDDGGSYEPYWVLENNGVLRLYNCGDGEKIKEPSTWRELLVRIAQDTIQRRKGVKA